MKGIAYARTHRPRVTLKCVADQYHGPNERIVEFMGAHGKNGGLIAFHEGADGTLRVDVYRCDDGVIVVAPEANLRKATTPTDEKGR